MRALLTLRSPCAPAFNHRGCEVWGFSEPRFPGLRRSVMESASLGARGGLGCGLTRTAQCKACERTRPQEMAGADVVVEKLKILITTIYYYRFFSSFYCRPHTLRGTDPHEDHLLFEFCHLLTASVLPPNPTFQPGVTPYQ